MKVYSLGKFLVAASLLGCSPLVTMAQAVINPYASAAYEHDSNVHRVPNSQYSLDFYGDPTLADSSKKITAGLDGTYQWGRQNFTEKLEVRRFDYDHFTDLNRFEYLANVAWTWKLANLFDGVLQYAHSRFGAPFQNNTSTTLELDTDSNFSGTLRYLLTPDWRLDAGVSSHVLYSPLQLYPDYTQHETGVHVGASYLGVTNLSYGVSLDRSSGSFSHAPDVGPYTQSSASLKVNYVLSGLDSFNGSVGYSRRDQVTGQQIGGNGGGSLSAVTGSLGYARQLSGKTSVNVQVIRAINSYAASGGAEIDTSATLGVRWLATYRLAVAATYGYTRSTFAGQVIPGSTVSGRYDHSTSEGLDVEYDVFRHVQLKAYLQDQSRTSNYALYGFSDLVAGIQATAHWR